MLNNSNVSVEITQTYNWADLVVKVVTGNDH